MYENARNSKDWYSSVFRASDTKIIDEEELEASKSLMSPEQYDQEFECSFDAGVLGGIYTRAISEITDKGQITKIVYDPQYQVNTHWDLGIGDATAIWFSQNVGNRIHLIEYYENSGRSLEHYVKYLASKDFKYENHYGPHDLKVRELGSGQSRVEIANNLGLYFTIVPKLSIEDGINAARMILPRCWFDFEKCKLGLEALRQYSWERNDRTGHIQNKPKHTWASHGSDAFRYLAVGLNQSTNFASNIKYPKSDVDFLMGIV